MRQVQFTGDLSINTLSAAKKRYNQNSTSGLIYYECISTYSEPQGWPFVTSYAESEVLVFSMICISSNQLIMH